MSTFISIIIIWLVATWFLSSAADSLTNKNNKQ